MGQSAGVAAPRLKKPSWKDPRLLIGVLLVLGSVAGVIALLGSADRTTQVYSAREDIAVGQVVTEADLSIVKVRLDEVEPSYVTVEHGFAEGKVALQRVAKNQLVPQASLGSADAVDRKPVALPWRKSCPLRPFQAPGLMSGLPCRVRISV